MCVQFYLFVFNAAICKMSSQTSLKLFSYSISYYSFPFTVARKSWGKSSLIGAVT